MNEFLNKLYSYEYFGFYLIISIIVLVILFLVILFFGKKDKKEREIEATKKLQQLNGEAFKEEDNKEIVEINPQEKLENDTIVMSTIEDVPNINNVEVNEEIPEPILPSSDNVLGDSIVSNNIDINDNGIKEELREKPSNINEIVIEPTNALPVIEEEKPILEKIEEKPFVFTNNDSFKEIEVPDITMAKEEIEEKPILKEVEVPEFNFDELVKDAEEIKKEESRPVNKGPQIFSSVYVPQKKEEVELPKVEIKEVKDFNSEDDGIELPTLKKQEDKKEEKVEMPILNDYNLDDLSGETYNINR